MGFLCFVLGLYNAVLIALASFAIISLRKEELVALLYLSFCCRVTARVLYLFLAVPWVCQWSVNSPY